MSNHRTNRISEEIKRELSQMIREEIKDPRVHQGLLSVTNVDVTNDLRYAKVFVSQLSPQETRNSTLQGLEKAAGYLRSELAKRLQLRYTPELLFKMDDSIEYGSKISKMIEDIKSQEGAKKSDV